MLLRYCIILIFLGFAFLQCEALNNPEYPIPLEEIEDNTGAYLKITRINSSTFDLNDVATAKYEFTGELHVVNNGQDVERINFYAAYNGVDQPDIEASEVPVASFTPETFTVQENGFLGATFSIYLTDAVSALDLNVDSLEFNGSFDLGWEIILEDGKVFTSADVSNFVSTIQIDYSPYFAVVPIVYSIPKDIFLGEYGLTQTGPGSDLFGQSIVFGSDPIMLEIDPSNTINGRIARDVCYLPAFGCFDSDIPFTFFRKQNFKGLTDANNWVTLSFNVHMGVGCGNDLILGPVQDESKSHFEVNEDSIFHFTILDNKNADCGGIPNEVSFMAVKQ